MAPVRPLPESLADGFVLLRPWRAGDLPQRYEGFADELCQRHSWPRVEPPTRAEVDEAFARPGDDLNLAIADAARPDRIWGAMSVYDLSDAQHRAAIGYWVAPWARGRGVATRSLRLLAGWTFAAFGLERLELTCGPDNPASARVAERCGFTREGVLRSHMVFKDSRRDTVVYSLLPGELTA